VGGFDCSQKNISNFIRPLLSYFLIDMGQISLTLAENPKKFQELGGKNDTQHYRTRGRQLTKPSNGSGEIEGLHAKGSRPHKEKSQPE
jgi:hypothetical protein